MITLLNTTAEYAWALPCFNVLAFILSIFLHRYITKKTIVISLGAIGLSFVWFMLILIDFISGGMDTILVDFDWIRIGDWVITWGFSVDRISIVMLGLITLVSLLVQAYSVEYMSGDSGISWYFGLQSFFVAAMLLLVIADNLLLLYFAWELVGLGSYLLIGFWYDRSSAAEAAKKAFITTRIGDVGLLIGIILLFKATGTFHISSIIHAATNGGIGEGTILLSSLLLFIGAMGKSAQFPLHVWLPDAMEGPTPVSALIHAATMVAAGVYLVSRMMPLFELVPAVLIVISSIGLFTFVFAGSIAMVMTDIKRILAYSTISHLGLMILVLGFGGVAAGLLHLVVHGISKALLFLGAGSVMHGMEEETRCEKMGGLLRKMPFTGVTFLIGALSLSGIVPLSGFFSKDEILVAILGAEVNEYWKTTFLIATLGGVLLSSLYMARLYFLVFTGEARSEQADNAHESSLLITGPLVILALIAVLFGALVFPVPLWDGYAGFGDLIHQGHHLHFVIWLTFISLFLAIAGFALGWLMYGNEKISKMWFSKKIPWVYRLLCQKYYVDEVYQWAINRIVLPFARMVAQFDRVIINDTGIDGSGMSVIFSAIKIRVIQTGRLYNYGLGMALGGLLLIIVWWWL